MEMTLIIVVFLLEGLWKTEAMSVKGKVNEKIEITCSHSYASTNIKYFCREGCTNQDILITSREKKDSNNKYSIKDEGNTFYVTISDLKKDDSGTYWCGIERVGMDTYNKVFLTVVDAVDSNTVSPYSETLKYIGLSLGAALLALAIVLLIFLRRRNRNISTSSGKEHDVLYATPSVQKQVAHHDNTTSRAVEAQEEINSGTNNIVCWSSSQHQDKRRDPMGTIYCNVKISSAPQIQSDHLFYSSVSFKNNTECSTVKHNIETATYSSVKHKTTEESTVYSNG